MKKIFTLFLLTVLTAQLSFACTTFFITKNGQMVFGRNYDWITGNGMICTNQRGLSKTSDKTKEGETVDWVSLYGSITFNQYGKEFPTGGMNEKGLVVELMWLDGTKYPAADKRPTLGVLQWIQYHLDNCATVDEVIANDKTIRISDDTPLHYLIADKTGNVATIEFLNGKMVVHKGGDLPEPVLTNDSYASSWEQVKAGTYNNSSVERFSKACSRLKQFRSGEITTPVIDYSFGILDYVAQGSHTKWSIVYDITNGQIYFKTLGFPAVKNIAFSAFDLKCSATAKAWDMNQPGSGNVAGSFVDFSLDLNNKMVNRSFDESVSQFTVGEQGRQETWQYAGKMTCVKTP